MNKTVFRRGLSILINTMLLLVLLSSLIIQDTIPGGDQQRFETRETSNPDSFFVLWENGTIVGINADLRVATIASGLLLFISIFATLIMHFRSAEQQGEEYEF